MRELISANNLHKSFAELRAVNGVSLRVNAGEVVGFLGPNGAGKTTTMRMLTGFHDPSSGSVSLNGFSLADDPIPARQTFGYLPEGAPAYPDMTVREYLQFIASARGIARREIASKIDDVAGRVRLRGVLDQVIETLSKGFKRRVGIAQA
ncbi:MAG: ABC transporter ATP-binding protein, partial [Planctomycetota bacterium]|nr:ABC transporter ATP-binding protein [Planctomycetota bacterium]